MPRFFCWPGHLPRCISMDAGDRSHSAAVKVCCLTAGGKQVPTLPQELQPERSIGPERDYFRFMQDALLHVGVIDKDRYALQPSRAVCLGLVRPGLGSCQAVRRSTKCKTAFRLPKPCQMPAGIEACPPEGPGARTLTLL